MIIANNDHLITQFSALIKRSDFFHFQQFFLYRKKYHINLQYALKNVGYFGEIFSKWNLSPTIFILQLADALSNTVKLKMTQSNTYLPYTEFCKNFCEINEPVRNFYVSFYFSFFFFVMTGYTRSCMLVFFLITNS